MKGVRDWIFSQILSKSLVSPTPLSGSNSFYAEGQQNEDFNEQGSDHSASSVASPIPSDSSNSSYGNQSNQHSSSLQLVSDTEMRQYQHNTNGRQKDTLAKVEDLQVKFFRLLQRLGQSQENLLVAKVLYRMHLATLIRAKESDLKRVNHSSSRARALASQQEATGMPQLDFSCRILVLGKTGVGKSATINSIFGQAKTITGAFQPATNCIQEVVGNVNGLNISFIDTPGFLPSSTNSMKRNKRIMLSIKRFIRKSPPDIVLYFERLDFINAGYVDFPLLKLVTEVFGSAIWFNTIIVMTHSSSTIPEGPDGYTINYESYISHCTSIIQQHIHQAVFDSRLENPVLLVENHSQCPKNIMGEKILPNGQVWRSQLLLFCICTKVLGDVNSLLKFQNSVELGPANSARIPSLPHLLSSLLRHRPVSNLSGIDDEIEEILLSDKEEEDEYDQLPSIRILTKSQFEKLPKPLKKDYLDEMDYRETLYLKKQLKEDYCRRREKLLLTEQKFLNSDNPDDQQAPPEPVLLPDMAVPPNFDSDCYSHRYRCLVSNDQWLVRPVLDPQGWDHDVGFDGINLETGTEIKKNVYASVVGQMNKNKQDFSIQSECAAAYVEPWGPTYSMGVDVQSTGKDLVCTVHSNTKFKNIKHNIADCGVSLTSFAKKYYVGAKLEDTVFVGKRLKFVLNAGRMEGAGQMAYGGSFEANLRGEDYPMRNDNVSLTMTVLSFNKEMVLSGSLQSEFRLTRSLRASVSANLNSRKMGQICIKTSSSEHSQIASIAIFSILKFLSRRKETKNVVKEVMN
ncbi:Translocase of chloroplast 90 [Spatholobus suberectus]|nr:Translocase of chloroplast 90 [Spatholobus suberectus]